MASSSAGTRGKSWCFTLFVEPDGEGNILSPPNPPWPELTFAIAQLERCPKTGSYHWQGYAQFGIRRRISHLKDIHPTAHWTIAEGSAAKNYAYCTKPESAIEGVPRFEFGTINDCTSQGKTTDYDKAFALIRSGTCASEEEFACAYSSIWIRFPTIFSRVKSLGHGGQRRDITVVLLYGPSRTGKSTYCYERYPGAYWKSPGKWWDGYNGEPSIVFDDLDGSWFPCVELLRILNSFPYRMENKGSHVNMDSTCFVISTNIHPDDWYQDHFQKNPEHREAIRNRISTVVQFFRTLKQDGTTEVTNSVMTGTAFFHPPIPAPIGYDYAWNQLLADPPVIQEQ